MAGLLQQDSDAVHLPVVAASETKKVSLCQAVGYEIRRSSAVLESPRCEAGQQMCSTCFGCLACPSIDQLCIFVTVLLGRWERLA